VAQVQVWLRCDYVHTADGRLAEGHGQVVEVGTNKRLAEIAQKWNLQECVVENPCQQGQAPRELLASTVEAILGAVWVDSDGDFRKVQKVFKKLCC
jgi:ribonuclease-3